MSECLPKATAHIFTGKLKLVGFAPDSVMQKYFTINSGCKIIIKLEAYFKFRPLYLVVGVR